MDLFFFLFLKKDTRHLFLSEIHFIPIYSTIILVILGVLIVNFSPQWSTPVSMHSFFNPTSDPSPALAELRQHFSSLRFTAWPFVPASTDHVKGSLILRIYGAGPLKTGGLFRCCLLLPTAQSDILTSGATRAAAPASALSRADYWTSGFAT